MSVSFVRSFCLLCVLLAAACAKEGGGPDQGSKPKPAAGQHAPADVKPGSHEDWCEEHQVPESQCTRCNPDLIPAFKATNDWCEEHGLPESQCTICNPDLKIQRPPKGA
jgi:hypothetical protein